MINGWTYGLAISANGWCRAAEPGPTLWGMFELVVWRKLAILTHICVCVYLHQVFNLRGNHCKHVNAATDKFSDGPQWSKFVCVYIAVPGSGGLVTRFFHRSLWPGLVWTNIERP